LKKNIVLDLRLEGATLAIFSVSGFYFVNLYNDKGKINCYIIKRKNKMKYKILIVLKLT